MPQQGHNTADPRYLSDHRTSEKYARNRTGTTRRTIILGKLIIASGRTAFLDSSVSGPSDSRLHHHNYKPLRKSHLRNTTTGIAETRPSSSSMRREAPSSSGLRTNRAQDRHRAPHHGDLDFKAIPPDSHAIAQAARVTPDTATVSHLPFPSSQSSAPFPTRGRGTTRLIKAKRRSGSS